MEGLGEAFVVVIVIVGLVFGVSRCSSFLEEQDENIKKLNDQRIATCFPSILDKEIEIDGVKYVICHSEPGSKDYKVKELAK